MENTKRGAEIAEKAPQSRQSEHSGLSNDHLTDTASKDSSMSVAGSRPGQTSRNAMLLRQLCLTGGGIESDPFTGGGMQPEDIEKTVIVEEPVHAAAGSAVEPPPPPQGGARRGQVLAMKAVPGRKRLEQAYDMLGKVSESEFKIVSVGKEKESGRKMAVKELLVMENHNFQDWRRFHGRVSAFKLFRHENLVKVDSIFHDDRQRFFLITEFVDGIRLDDYLRIMQKLPSDDFIGITRQLLSALAECHHHDLVHGSVTTAQIMLNVDKKIKLLEPGFGGKHGSLQESIADIDLPSRDLAGVGRVLLEMITGDAMRDVSNLDVALHGCGMQEGEARFVKEFIAKLLSADDGARYHTAEEALVDLMAFSIAAQAVPLKAELHTCLACRSQTFQNLSFCVNCCFDRKEILNKGDLQVVTGPGSRPEQVAAFVRSHFPDAYMDKEPVHGQTIAAGLSPVLSSILLGLGRTAQLDLRTKPAVARDWDRPGTWLSATCAVAVTALVVALFGSALTGSGIFLVAGIFCVHRALRAKRREQPLLTEFGPDSLLPEFPLKERRLIESFRGGQLVNASKHQICEVFLRYFHLLKPLSRGRSHQLALATQLVSSYAEMIRMMQDLGGKELEAGDLRRREVLAACARKADRIKAAFNILVAKSSSGELALSSSDIRSLNRLVAGTEAFINRVSGLVLGEQRLAA